MAAVNYIAPYKRPLSAMSPSIVVNKDGSLRMVAGASGGQFIVSATLQALAKYGLKAREKLYHTRHLIRE